MRAMSRCGSAVFALVPHPSVLPFNAPATTPKILRLALIVPGMAIGGRG